jgi:hypothetical protein
MKFHEKLRELKGGMSEAALAGAAGLPYPSVHSYCLGRRMPTFGAVVMLARALGTTCEAFADCDDIAADRGGKAKPRGRPRKEK